MMLRLLFVLAVVLVAVADKPRCDPEKDMKGYYLSCNDDGLRDMIWYWDDRECDATGMQTRERVENLPCDIDCTGGEYLPWGTTSCQTCPAGTYSIGGGARFEHFDTWPRERSVIFRTWCARPANYEAHPGDKEPCDGWRLNGYYIDSGDLSDYNSIYSVLVASFVLSEDDSYLRFQYSLDTERGDGLWIQVDNDPPRELSATAEYKEITLYFTKGLHFVSWVYYKDANNDMTEGAEDLAKLDFIELYGLRLSDDECTPCTPGFASSHPGASLCDPCDFNTFAAEHGATECIDCDPSEYALRGQRECMERDDPCEDDDYELLYTECHEEAGGWYREQVASWVQPDFCLHDGTVELPETKEQQNCRECSPGFHGTGPVGSDCRQCPDGQFSDGNVACQPCKAGSAAVRGLFYEEWDEWQPGFTTGCNGDDCKTDGWELHSTQIHTGRIQGQRVDVWVQLQVDVGDFGGGVEFSFKLEGGSRYSFFQFLIDGYYGGIFRQQVEDFQTAYFELEPGHHELVWNFHRLDATDAYPNARAYIQDIAVLGTLEGGARECVTCPAGYAQGGDEAVECERCMPGTASAEPGAKECMSCNGPNEFSRNGVLTECEICGEGTQPNADHSDCITDCVFRDVKSTSGEHIYDLTPLNERHTVGGLRNDSVFYVHFCGRNLGKCSDTDPYICEGRSVITGRGDELVFEYDSGNFLEFRSAKKSEYEFELAYLGGTYEDCAPGKTRETLVRFKCDLTAQVSTMVILPESDQCENVFEVVSPFACRICTAGDYNRKEGSCDGSHRTVTFTKKEDAMCLHTGADSVEETCADVELSWAPVIIITIVVLAVVVGIVAVLFYVYRKKQQLEHKYSMLVSSSGDGVHVEMSDAAA